MQDIDSILEPSFDLRIEGNYAEAIDSFLKIDAQFLNHPKVIGMLGICYYENQQLENARFFLSRAVELIPEKSIVSLALFHTLWQLDLKDEAFCEAQRLKELTGSNEYDEILNEFV